jgi:mono/diheme cytochrome c family protein
VRQVSRQPYPGYAPEIERAAGVWARYCVGCHVIDGDGGKDGPELTHIGSKHDAAALRGWIVDPEAVKPDTDMPAFGNRLSPAQLDAISQFLAGRR